MPHPTIDRRPAPASPIARRRATSVALWSGLVLGVALLFGSWVLLDGRHHVPGWETDVFHAVNDLPNGLEWPLWPIMLLGTFWTVSLAGVVAWLLTRRPGPVIGAVVAVLSAWASARLIKALVGRARPGDLLAGVHVRETGVDGYGYVSGHSAVAFATATVLTPLLPRRWRAVPLLLAAVVAFARVWFGVHLPLDVIGGAGLGILCGLAGIAITGRTGEPGRGRTHVSDDAPR